MSNHFADVHFVVRFMTVAQELNPDQEEEEEHH